jgi:G8 domain
MRSSSAGAIVGILVAISSIAGARAEAGVVTVHSAKNGAWSDPGTWTERRIPKAGDVVQVAPGHTVTYDVDSSQAIRMIHVAGTLIFAHDRTTRLDVGLIRVDPHPVVKEEGFHCRLGGITATDDAPTKGPPPSLVIGTRDRPIRAGVTATIRLVYFPGTDPETLPAIVNCGGYWDIHGAPLSRTWVKLGATTKAGTDRVTLAEPVTGWRVGDRVIVTAATGEGTHVSRPSSRGEEVGGTEERFIAAIDGSDLVLDRPLAREHPGEGDYRGEVANLSRNVVVESADPDGVRGHTMFHRGSLGGISYAEFRHLGKEGVLGKYPIHFHLVKASMRGSGVLGASVWDSHNRWITIHGTDYLLIRDCVGYRSVGHGFFLEDATEQYNVLDRNLAVQAFNGRRLPDQVLPFEDNRAAGFWWANGRNTLTRNVSCENEEYGFRYEISEEGPFDTRLPLRMPDGTSQRVDVRHIPFFRFEGNESHNERLYGFYFGEDKNPSVRGDRRHPFIVRDLKVWMDVYSFRPSVQFFLADGVTIFASSYGVYHPDFDSHVYRNITLKQTRGNTIIRSHADESIQYGSFSFENLLLEDCGWREQPLIQMACTSPKRYQAGHFRNVVVRERNESGGYVVDLLGRQPNPKLQNGVTFYFHDTPAPGRCLKVVSARFTDLMTDGDYRSVSGFTGKDVLAAKLPDVAFPALLDPVDDLAPATMITRVRRGTGKVIVTGVSHDNGAIASVLVNGRPAGIRSDRAGVVDWEAEIDPPAQGMIVALAVDKAGNHEVRGDRIAWKR